MNFANWSIAGPSTGSCQQNGVLEEVMRSGNVPVAGKMGMCGGGGVVPPALLDENRVPRFYLEAISACGATHATTLPHTALVYNLMVTSGLPRPVLSYIWSAVNRSLPGQLTRPEFFSCLALIALAQKGESLAALSGMSQLPIPFLQACAVPVPAAPFVPAVTTVRPPPGNVANAVRNPPNQVPATQTASPSKSRFAPSAFIPTSLLPRRDRTSAPPSVGPPIAPASTEQARNSSKSIDVLSDIFPSSTLSIFSSDTATGTDPSGSRYSSSNSQQTTRSEPSSSSLDSNSSGSSYVATKRTSTSKSSGPTGHSGGSLDLVPSLNSPSSAVASGVRATSKNASHTDPQQLECWVRALCGACELFEEADALWKPEIEVEVLREVAATERGEAYLCALGKALVVVNRLNESALGVLPPDVSRRAERAKGVWTRLQPLSAHRRVEQESSDGVDSVTGCGICSVRVALSMSIDYGGRVYHSECANLWVNRINPLLPNLHLR